MKTHSIVSGLLAGLGFYLLVFGTIALISSIPMLVFELTGGPQLTSLMVVAQIWPFFVKFGVGCLMLCTARKVGPWLARAAGVEDSQVGMEDGSLILVAACVIAGVVVALDELPGLMKLAVAQATVSGTSVKFGNAEETLSSTLLIRDLFTLALAAVLIFRAKPIGRWFANRG